MGMLDSIINPDMRNYYGLEGFGTPSFTDSLREYARSREHMSPKFRPLTDVDKAARNYDPTISAPLTAADIGPGGVPQQSDLTSIPGAEGIPSPAASDPYASAPPPPPGGMAAQPPIPMAGMLSDMGVLHLGQGDSPPASPAAAPAADGSAFDTGAAPINAPGLKQTVPLANAARPQDVALPANAKPVQQQQPTLPPETKPGAGFLSRISNMISNNPSTLLALGAGFAGAPNFGQGMSRAFAAAIPASKQDQQQGIQRSQIGETYKALIGAGVSPQEALAAAYNPEVMKSVTQRVFGMNATWGIIGHDDFGNPKYGFINSALQTAVPAEKVTTPRVATPEEVLRLPKGQHFIGWDNQEHVR